MNNKDVGRKPLYAVSGLLVVLMAIAAFQAYQISALGSEISALNSEVGVLTAGIKEVRNSIGEIPPQVSTASGGTDTGGTVTLQEVVDDITPTGTPDYGSAAGVSYDDVEGGLVTLMGYHSMLSLGGDDEQRYIGIATAPGTACEFCCGIGGAGFGTPDGNIACGCSHNIAFSGLTKYLITNTDYTDQQIYDEIQNWKTLFFPQGMLERELEMREISPESVGLPAMRGGC